LVLVIGPNVGNMTEGVNLLKESLVYAVWKLSCLPSIQKGSIRGFQHFHFFKDNFKQFITWL
jgi:hypothetical protein